MVTRKEKVLAELIKLSSRSLKLEKNYIRGIEASEISAETGIDRSNVSRELNKLVHEGYAVKISGRPARFLDKNNYLKQTECISTQKNTIIDLKSEINPISLDNQEFQFFIGESGSLKAQINLGKAAMIYPPRGLHTIITGPTGTGKTTFAEKLYEYSKHMNVIKNNSTFVSFNCSEYFETPNLLLSQLFGHAKGAFTGADRDKIGLVEKANDGILFLDEIHRLPPIGQEMLFLLIDKGTFRRLGETNISRKSNILIIAATTENLETSLLRTFSRRIPVTINLPSLKERPLNERIQLIDKFFKMEQQRVGTSVAVSKNVIISLLFYDCPGNIGQLRTDIQLLCAESFLDYKLNNRDIMVINSFLLHRSVNNNYYYDKINFEELSDYVLFSQGKSNINMISIFDIQQLNNLSLYDNDKTFKKRDTIKTNSKVISLY